MAEGTNVDIDVETTENENGATLYAKSQVGDGTDNRHTVQGEVTHDSLEEVEAEREDLVESVTETTRALVENGADVRAAVLADDDEDDE